MAVDRGREALAGEQERQGERELKRRIARLERALGRKTSGLGIAGELSRGWEWSVRVARSRRLVAVGRKRAVVAVHSWRTGNKAPADPRLCRRSQNRHIRGRTARDAFCALVHAQQRGTGGNADRPDRRGRAVLTRIR